MFTFSNTVMTLVRLLVRLLVPKSSLKSGGDTCHISESVTTDKTSVKKIQSYEDTQVRFFVEYVTVPEQFEIEPLLTFREKVGVFNHDKVDLKQVKALASAVSYNPIFSTLNNPQISLSSCIYFLHVLKEADLIMTSIPNSCRDMINLQSEVYEQNGRYDSWEIDSRGNEQIYDVFGNIIIINLFNLFNQELINDCYQKVVEYIKYQEKIKHAIETNTTL